MILDRVNKEGTKNRRKMFVVHPKNASALPRGYNARIFQ